MAPLIFSVRVVVFAALAVVVVLVTSASEVASRRMTWIAESRALVCQASQPAASGPVPTTGFAYSSPVTSVPGAANSVPAAFERVYRSWSVVRWECQTTCTRPVASWLEDTSSIVASPVSEVDSIERGAPKAFFAGSNLRTRT